MKKMVLAFSLCSMLSMGCSVIQPEKSAVKEYVSILKSMIKSYSPNDNVVFGEPVCVDKDSNISCWTYEVRVPGDPTYYHYLLVVIKIKGKYIVKSWN